MTSYTDYNRRKKIYYQSNHRGTKEADILIGGFVKKNLDRMTSTELDQLEELLSTSDPDLMLWLNGQEVPEKISKTSVWQQIIKFKNKD